MSYVQFVISMVNVELFNEIVLTQPDDLVAARDLVSTSLTLQHNNNSMHYLAIADNEAMIRILMRNW